jgi:hypothetical protein
MTGGQIAALIFALLLLLPGGCFVFLGFAMMSESTDFAGQMLAIGVVILAVMGLLFWLAFRKSPPPPPGAGTTDA